MPQLSDSAHLLLQRALPQHLLSRAAGLVANSRTGWLKNLLIRAAIRRYAIDLTDAAETDYRRYASFNDFFTRALHREARPLAGDEHTLASPVDGVVSAAGELHDNQILQAKGHRFSIGALVGAGSSRTQALSGGSFVTIYLSPRDYHRVHAPLAGALLEANYLPGRLFSVNPRTDRALPGLYAGNERLTCWLATAAGDIALVMVGALLVAGIETPWLGCYQPGRALRKHFDVTGQPLAFSRGDELGRFRGQEMGRFRFGSTVILLVPPGIDLQPMATGDPIRMGARLAASRPRQKPTSPSVGIT